MRIPHKATSQRLKDKRMIGPMAGSGVRIEATGMMTEFHKESFNANPLQHESR